MGQWFAESDVCLYHPDSKGGQSNSVLLKIKVFTTYARAKGNNILYTLNYRVRDQEMNCI